MRVLGLDTATHIGMYRLSKEDEGKGKSIHFPDARGYSRLQLIARAVEYTIKQWEPEFAVIESYALGTKGRLVTLVECGTVIRTTLYLLRIPWVEVTPSALKKWTTGSGNADKSKMAECVLKRWGFKSHSDDITDAYALAQMGLLDPTELRGIKGVVAGG